MTTAAKALYDRAADVLGYDLAELCFNGPAEQLDATDHSQPGRCRLACMAG